MSIDLTRGVEAVFPSVEALRSILEGGRKLTVYLGVDPTGPHLHLGHATNLLLLKRFQDHGHRIIFLIGDFTARIGDPTDKLSPRQPLSVSEIKKNFATFRHQASRVIRFRGKNAAKVVWNSRWFSRLRLADLLKIMGQVTVQQMVERNMFQVRIKEGKPIGLNEFIYPLLQGYDSVALDVDIEIGGNDQTFNMLMGRDLVRTFKNKEKFVITTTLLVNPDSGAKLMNKSSGGMINLDDSPVEMYGKLMSLPDGSVYQIAKLCTEVEEDFLLGWQKDLHPKDFKMKVSRAVVELYHGVLAAETAEAEFIRTFQAGGLPESAPEIRVRVGEKLSEAVLRSGLVVSNSEFRRLVEAGAVNVVGGEVILDPARLVVGPINLKIGKHRFLKITV